ncbi:MAG: hypothetical protein HY784_11465 [Chloroflexi bacterium]|nr:hypothetical protein [Chloroflexota bacterium]
MIWAHALFDHIPPETIRATLIGLAPLLAPTGSLYATIFLNPHGPDFREPIFHQRDGKDEGGIVTYPDKEYWHHTLAFFQNVGEYAAGLRFAECLQNYRHPLGLKVLRFQREK